MHEAELLILGLCVAIPMAAMAAAAVAAALLGPRGAERPATRRPPELAGTEY